MTDDAHTARGTSANADVARTGANLELDRLVDAQGLLERARRGLDRGVRAEREQRG